MMTMRSTNTRPIGTARSIHAESAGIASPKRAQSETEIHRIAAEAINSVRDDTRGWIEWDRISAGAFLGHKSADVQRNAGDNDHRAKYPSELATHEAGRNKPFERKRREDRQDE